MQENKKFIRFTANNYNLTRLCFSKNLKVKKYVYLRITKSDQGFDIVKIIQFKLF